MRELDKMIELVAGSDYFLVMATSSLAHDLRNETGDVYLQSKIAKKYNKPTFILYVKNKITEKDKIDIERFYSAFDVIKILEVDFHSEEDIERLKKELEQRIKNCILKDDANERKTGNK